MKNKFRELLAKVVTSFDNGKIFLIVPQMGFYSHSSIFIIIVINFQIYSSAFFFVHFFHRKKMQSAFVLYKIQRFVDFLQKLSRNTKLLS